VSAAPWIPVEGDDTQTVVLAIRKERKTKHGCYPYGASAKGRTRSCEHDSQRLLCLGTANRLARVLDRTRVVSAQLARLGASEDNRAMNQRQLEGLEVRWNLVLRGLRLCYMSLGSCLVVRCAIMMQETRLAVQNLAEEVQKAAYA
jgi:hypothetical protein